MLVVNERKKDIKRKIRGIYVPGNQGKEEAYARIDAGVNPELVLYEFKEFAASLVRQENEEAARQATLDAQTRAQAKLRQPMMA